MFAQDQFGRRSEAGDHIVGDGNCVLAPAELEERGPFTDERLGLPSMPVRIAGGVEFGSNLGESGKGIGRLFQPILTNAHNMFRFGPFENGRARGERLARAKQGVGVSRGVVRAGLEQPVRFLDPKAEIRQWRFGRSQGWHNRRDLWTGWDGEATYGGPVGDFLMIAQPIRQVLTHFFTERAPLVITFE